MARIQERLEKLCAASAARHVLTDAIDCLDAMEAALRECLLEHGGFTIRGECERNAKAALAKLEASR